jgi:hypothetical protein
VLPYGAKNPCRMKINIFAFALFFVYFSVPIRYTDYKSLFYKASVKKQGVKKMIGYKKLWHLPLDKNLKKKDFITLVGVSSYTIGKPVSAFAHGHAARHGYAGTSPYILCGS